MADLLQGVHKLSEYGRTILPLTVLGTHRMVGEEGVPLRGPLMSCLASELESKAPESGRYPPGIPQVSQSGCHTGYVGY